MNRQRKMDETLWDDGEEPLSADHVVERFFAQHERDAVGDPRHRGADTPRLKRRPARPAGAED